MVEIFQKKNLLTFFDLDIWLLALIPEFPVCGPVVGNLMVATPRGDLKLEKVHSLLPRGRPIFKGVRYSSLSIAPALGENPGGLGFGHLSRGTAGDLASWLMACLILEFKGKRPELIFTPSSVAKKGVFQILKSKAQYE